jgi:hypothetical protein
VSASRVQARPPDGYSSTLVSMIGGIRERGGDARMEGRNASIGGGTKKVAAKNLQEQTTGAGAVM